MYFHSPVAGLSLHVFDVSWSHTTTRHSRQDFSVLVINPSQRPLPHNTQQSQQTNIHAPGGIRTHNLSRRAAEDLRLRLRGHSNRQQKWVPGVFPGGKGGRCVSLTTLPPSRAIVMKSGNHNFLEPAGPVTGLLYLYLLLTFVSLQGNIIKGDGNRISFVNNVALLIQISSALLPANWRPVLQQNVKLDFKDRVMSTTWLNYKWGGHFLERRRLFYLHSFFYNEAYVCDIVCVSAVPVNIVAQTDLQNFMWETYQCKT